MPKSAVYSGVESFPFDRELTEVTFAKGVTSIGNGAFRECSSLADITIPEGVTSIGIKAFRGCSSLAAITIPDRVTTISNYAFWGCSSLMAITIPDDEGVERRGATFTLRVRKVGSGWKAKWEEKWQRRMPMSR